MSNFLLQLAADSITVIMRIATITLAVFLGMVLRKAKNKKTAN